MTLQNAVHHILIALDNKQNKKLARENKIFEESNTLTNIYRSCTHTSKDESTPTTNIVAHSAHT